MKDGLLKKGLLKIFNALPEKRLIRTIESLQHTQLGLQDHERGNLSIREAVESAKPHAIGKFGTIEIRAFKMSIDLRGNAKAEQLSAETRRTLYTNAGVFPDDYGVFSRYGQLLENVLPEMTVMCPVYKLGEARIIKRYCKDAVLISGSSLHACYHSKVHWTSALAGRKVLVALPFEQTVRQQYARREHLWPTKPWILPEFQLDTLKVYPHAHLVKPVHRDWFAALDAMRSEMDRRDFDVVLIGAGAYSLPLAVHAKRLGKQGIHLGGATQFLFGIKGGRWDNTPEADYYNEHWCRPLPEEIPTGVEAVEKGCYW